MKFVEFFAGVGLVREGLAGNGWICSWANDICEKKMQTYISNYGDHDFHLGDVWRFADNSSTIPDDAFLYTASFPCTDLSVAGGRAGLAGTHSGSLNAVLKIILSKRESGSAPKVVMLENVAGFLTSHDGDDVRDTVKIFNDLGYVVDIIEINADCFTPQSRHRVFLIAVDKDIAPSVMTIKENTDSILDGWWDLFKQKTELRSIKLERVIKKNPGLSWGLLDVPALPKLSQTLDDIIDTTISGDSELWWNTERKEKLYSQMSDKHKDLLAEMCSKNAFSYGTVYRRMRKGLSMAEMRTDGIAGCLRTPRGGSSKQIVVQAGFGSWSVRLLTPREYARLQGVRDSYILPKNDNQGYFAMGDAVCVPVIDFISRNILTPIFNTYVQTRLKKAS
ncbi:DNA (cytosine-5-)-methyltransferase [Vibrio sp. ABG19]|uniref:DNA cytosine methyltransferase n=1 Tax=Vibrio sp. ABG19 TaxID=2817385 RepID=UPI00249E337B|nr:DNA (cytosine-5-)-methyltransferase [Vibrio sp. ABG19]WGY48389.1 DNA (cytosine-5-)-methyltransferase [Vibrio sp. ABG19]